LLNLALAYPTGWVIDRFGGLRVVLFYFVCQLACFIWLLNVRDKSGLILLSLATTLIGPLYTAADIMVYKSVPRKDVGSYTATNSCLRNLFVAALGLVSGWAIFAAGHNYLVGFGIGIGMSSVGLVMFIIHHRVMSRGADVPNSRAGSLPRNAPVSPL
jgi:nitrate/nitrite transporter NarK